MRLSTCRQESGPEGSNEGGTFASCKSRSAGTLILSAAALVLSLMIYKAVLNGFAESDRPNSLPN